MKRSAAPAGEKRCAWEKGRRERPVTTDAVLCYGGSHHRTPFLWDGKRLAPYVTYTDEEGREQWLFDGFIFLEFVDASRPDGRTYAFETGNRNAPAAGKEQWQELIDYFFAEGNCIDALDKSVAEAERRIGRAPTLSLIHIYVGGSYYTEGGMFNMADNNNYDAQMNFNRFSFRSNIDINITKSTELGLSLSTQYTNKMCIRDRPTSTS